jgi:hypothetical protein
MLTCYCGESASWTTPRSFTPLLAWSTDTGRDAHDSTLPAVVSDPEQADIFALPHVWSHYVAGGRFDEARAMADGARLRGKPVLVWHTGDLTPILPFDNAQVLANAIARSRRRPNWHVAPRFIDDPLAIHADGMLVSRAKPARPLVGFCGYGAASGWKIAYSVGHGALARLRAWGGREPYEPAPMLPAALLRSRVLRRLRAHRGVDVTFIVRTRYRGGVRTADSRHPTAVEFFRNMLDTDYTVCVRGYGNWSIRFYETLACGRIPVLIDTDCTLPFDNAIDWQRICVWVPDHDVAHVGEYVADFHSRLSNREFRDHQRHCRAIWERYLTPRGFLGRLQNLLGAPAVPVDAPAAAPAHLSLANRMS